MELSQSLSYSQTPSPWEQGVSGVHFLKLEIKIQDETLFEITEGGCPLFFFLFRKTKLTECSNHPPDPKVLRFFQTVFGNYYFHTPAHGQSKNGKSNFRQDNIDLNRQPGCPHSQSLVNNRLLLHRTAECPLWDKVFMK